MSEEAELIRALAEDLALEILASYTSADDFDDADFSSLGKAAFISRNTQADQDQRFRNLSLKCRPWQGR